MQGSSYSLLYVAAILCCEIFNEISFYMASQFIKFCRNKYYLLIAYNVLELFSLLFSFRNCTTWPINELYWIT
jgi:hypothetical protein